MPSAKGDQVHNEIMQWATQSGFKITSVTDSKHDFVLEVEEKESLPSVQVIHQKTDHAYVLMVGYVRIPENDRNTLKTEMRIGFNKMIWDIKISLAKAGVDFLVHGTDEKDPDAWEVQKRLYTKGTTVNQFHEAYSKVKNGLITIIWSYKSALDMVALPKYESISGGQPSWEGPPSEGGLAGPERARKIMNTMMNTSIILMITLLDGFAQTMLEATGVMAAGMAEAVGGEESGEEVANELEQRIPEAKEQMKAMISEVRKDIYEQMDRKKGEIEPMLADKAFDAGPEIVDIYEFGLPKLTEELDDDIIAQYAQLLVQEDRYFTEMFGELTKWINTLPQLPK